MQPTSNANVRGNTLDARDIERNVVGITLDAADMDVTCAGITLDAADMERDAQVSRLMQATSNVTPW